VFREEVEEDDQRGVQVARKRGENVAEGGYASGRGEERDPVASGCIRPPHSGLRVQPG
jgi:hypothetical protein